MKSFGKKNLLLQAIFKFCTTKCLLSESFSAAEQALGMENLKIPDSAITASSMYDSNHAPYMGRLNNKKTQNGIGAWVVQQQGGVLDFNATTYPALCFYGNTYSNFISCSIVLVQTKCLFN